MWIDQLDHALPASGMSPQVTSSPYLGQLSSGSASARPEASLSARSITDEIKLTELQRDKLALKLEVLKLRNAATDKKFAHEVNKGADPAKLSTARKKHTIDWPHEFCERAPITEFHKLELANARSSKSESCHSKACR